MPNEQAHLEQAAHNEAFLATIDGDTNGDWAVTVLFYAALHYVDAYLARKNNEHPGGHDERDRLIQSHPTTKASRAYYRRLLDRSHDARYKCVHLKAAAVLSLKATDFEPLKRSLTT